MHPLFVEIYEQLNEVNENVVEPARHLSTVAETGQSTLARQHLAIVEMWLEAMAEQLQALGQSDDPVELLEREAALAETWRNRLLAMLPEVRGQRVSSSESRTPPPEPLIPRYT